MSEDIASPRKIRRWLLVLMLLALGVRPSIALAQEVATLRPGETIELPGIAITVLGLKVTRGGTSTATLRLRAVAAPERDILVGLDAFRLIVGGVPIEPVYATTDERIMSSFLLNRDSGVEFTRVFRFSDRSSDLVLQIRINGALERRRLPAS